MEYNILDFGAVGDGITNDAKAIQKAIDTCAKQGGGRVVFPGGKTYYSGSILLRSHVELYLEMGTKVLAAKKLSEYGSFEELKSLDTSMKVPSYVNCDYAGKPKQYFIYGKDLEDVAISGFGVIDGSEEIFYGKMEEDFIDGSFYPRIPLLYLEHIKHLTITNVTLQRSAFWTTHMIGCEDVLISGIRILNNMKLANCDGIDPDHCKNVRISDCYIACADDCIVLKNTEANTKYGKCENILITGCTLISSSAAIKFGTESEGIFEHVNVSNCTLSGQRGISLQLRDSGCIRDCSFQNLSIETKRAGEIWWGEAEPIAITALDRKEGTHVGEIYRIAFQNIFCSSENGIFIYGNPKEKNIHDIWFSNVSVNLVEKTSFPKKNHDLRPSRYAERIDGTCNVLYLRNADEIDLSGIRGYVDKSMKPYMGEEMDVQ